MLQIFYFIAHLIICHFLQFQILQKHIMLKFIQPLGVTCVRFLVLCHLQALLLQLYHRWHKLMLLSISDDHQHQRVSLQGEQYTSPLEPLADKNGKFAHFRLKIQQIINHLCVVNENVIGLSQEDLATTASF